MSHVPHALILTGGDSAHRDDAARTLTASFLCLSGEGLSCGTCPACRKVFAGSHPDVFFLRPEPREIVVSQVRSLCSSLLRKPHEGRYQVAVIEADTLNTHAQNALLAILEEPPGPVRFLLLSENPARLLSTVRSRCAVRRLPDLPGNTRPGQDAVALRQALSSENEWTWVSTCLSLEKRPREELSHILDELAALLVSDLPGLDILTARRFGGIIDGTRVWRDMLEANVGAGHVCGALAAAYCGSVK